MTEKENKETRSLFEQEVKVLNVGTSIFKDDLDRQDVPTVQVNWQPPAGGNAALVEKLDRLFEDERIDVANAEAVSRIKAAQPILVDIQKALDVIPGMHEKMILHAGPPISWERMAGPMKGAIIGALLYEGMADSEEEAIKLAESGEIEFSPCNEHQAVGPMAGIISPSMPVHIIENRTHGNRSFSTVNEGLGKVLRFGAYSDEVLERLHWIETVFSPALREALRLSTGIDLRAITAQALHMGDECHNRNKAATSLFFREIADYFLQTGLEKERVREVLRFIKNNDHYFLNLSMAACKSALEAAQGVPHSTIVTTMARNGVDFGVRVSGAGEKEWFTAPANFVQGLFFPGFSAEDAAPDLGDSAITETMGIGGFAMGASPAIVQFVGGNVDDAIRNTLRMYTITEAENSNYSLPPLNFRGAPFGIDLRKIVDTGVLPIINTGMAHKEAGIGQIGAGIVNPPMACFEQALMRLALETGGGVR